MSSNSLNPLPTNIDWSTLIGLMHLKSSLASMAREIGVSVETLSRHKSPKHETEPRFDIGVKILQHAFTLNLEPHLLEISGVLRKTCSASCLVQADVDWTQLFRLIRRHLKRQEIAGRLHATDRQIANYLDQGREYRPSFEVGARAINLADSLPIYRKELRAVGLTHLTQETDND